MKLVDRILLGSMYTFVLADAVARYHREGRDWLQIFPLVALVFAAVYLVRAFERKDQG